MAIESLQSFFSQNVNWYRKMGITF